MARRAQLEFLPEPPNDKFCVAPNNEGVAAGKLSVTV